MGKAMRTGRACIDVFLACTISMTAASPAWACRSGVISGSGPFRTTVTRIAPDVYRTSENRTLETVACGDTADEAEVWLETGFISMMIAASDPSCKVTPGWIEFVETGRRCTLAKFPPLN